MAKLKNSSGLQYAIQGNGTFGICGMTVPELPAGAYELHLDGYGKPHFHSKELKVDELIDFSGSFPSQILSEIEKFWEMGPRFARYGFLHRRGYLFYGKQGCGKSSLIHQIVTKIIGAGHVAFFCRFPQHFLNVAEQFRKVEPERPMVCIFEDVDALIHHYGDSDLLQWLDGNTQVDKAVNIASTNYPEKLDKRIVSRPRRFDRVLKIQSPDARMRAEFLKRKLHDQTEAERSVWVELSEGLPFAALAELIISVRCLGNDLNQTIETLRELDAATPSSDEFGTEAQPSEYDPEYNGANPY